jgi:hypothetical protein
LEHRKVEQSKLEKFTAKTNKEYHERVETRSPLRLKLKKSPEPSGDSKKPEGPKEESLL